MKCFTPPSWRNRATEMETEKRPFKRPPLRDRAMETTITLRIPVEMKEKLDRISGGRRAEWISRKIEAERE